LKAALYSTAAPAMLELFSMMCSGITHLPWVAAVQMSSAIDVASRADLVPVFDSLLPTMTCCKNYINDCGGV